VWRTRLSSELMAGLRIPVFSMAGSLVCGISGLWVFEEKGPGLKPRFLVNDIQGPEGPCFLRYDCRTAAMEALI